MVRVSNEIPDDDFPDAVMYVARIRENPPKPWWLHTHRIPLEVQVRAATCALKNRDEAVILSAESHDGRTWLHMSISHATRVPKWDEYRDAKDLFLGTDRDAVQILPRQSRYVNVHPYTLHAFAPFVGEIGLPDFRSTV